MRVHLVCSTLLAFFSLTSASLASSAYDEKLLLRPLPQSALLASFNFRSNASSDAFDEQHFRFFPRSLGQILQHAHAKEVHLRFSLGRWDAENWGARPWDGAREGGTGVELWAWVEANTDEQAKARWLTLTNALSGLFCASLNFIDSTKTIQPVVTFQTEGTHGPATNGSLHLLHGTLPHEVVCTENLTPFLKLLPCKGKAGISSLLDGHKLFDASWQTMSIDVRPVCATDGAQCVLEMEQTVDMVLDMERSKRPRDNPIPRPPPIEQISCDTSKSYNSHDTCFPSTQQGEPSWSLKEVFGRALKGSCTLSAGKSKAKESVCISVPPEREYTVNTTQPHLSQAYEDGFLRCYTLSPNEDVDFEFPAQTLQTQTPLLQPRLHAARSFNGLGQERGSVQATLTNPSAHGPVSLVYLESLPWFMKPYLHTLRATITSSGANNTFATPFSATESGHDANAIHETYYKPAVDRHRGTHLELVLTVPPASTLTLTYDFEKVILRYTEYPPDANRGFDVAPAIIRLLDSDYLATDGDAVNAKGRGTFLRTTSLLLPLPTPDFSMPYNVIILTSTVMALGFGSIFNPLVRRFVGADEDDGSEGGVKARILSRLAALRTKLTGKGAKVQ